MDAVDRLPRLGGDEDGAPAPIMHKSIGRVGEVFSKLNDPGGGQQLDHHDVHSTWSNCD